MKKFKILMAVSAMLTVTSAAYALMGDDVERGRVDMPEAAQKLLPDNGSILASVTADLDGDGTSDFLIAFEYLDAVRELIVVVNKAGKYKIAARSKRAVLCAECGGVYGDPFVRIWAEKKKFGVDHFGGSNWKWSNNSVFGYSRRDNRWQLVEFQSANYDLDANAEEEHLKPADFGLINLEEFDIDSAMNGSVVPVPDETQVAINEQKTAVAETQTAVVVESYTPTPIPTYFYKKPEQLKNREMIKISGATFTQTDGKASFKHTLSGYSIGKYPVTYELWYVVKKWAEKNGYVFHSAGAGKWYGQNELPVKDSSGPVIGVTRRDAIVWCNAYSEMTKKKPVYFSDAGFKTPIKSAEDEKYSSTENNNPGSFDSPYVNWAADGYRLPTEGEWAYAITYIDGKEWAPPEAEENKKNGLGVVYVRGQVSEWLWDSYADYPAGDQKDYRGPETGGARVLRGGPDPVDFQQKVNKLGTRLRVYPLAGSFLNGFRAASK